MRNLLIILSLFLSLTAVAYEKVYLQKTYNPYAYNTYRTPVRYNYYRPYRSYQYYNPYTYTRVNSNNINRIRRLRTIRRLNRQFNPYLTWNTKNKNGNLTGYSVPVTKDIYDQMGISPYDPKSKQKTNSPTCKTDLFSSPSGDEMYYTNGERRVNLGGTQGKTGVTIIYD